MTDPGVPEGVQRFIADNIDSAEQLELLILLHDNPAQEWDPESASKAIYTVPQSAELRMRELAARGLITQTDEQGPRFRYAPGSTETERQVRELASAYRTRRVAVINLIYARPADPVRSFADAFKLRKDR